MEICECTSTLFSSLNNTFGRISFVRITLEDAHEDNQLKPFKTYHKCVYCRRIQLIKIYKREFDSSILVTITNFTPDKYNNKYHCKKIDDTLSAVKTKVLDTMTDMQKSDQKIINLNNMLDDPDDEDENTIVECSLGSFILSRNF